MIQLLAFLLIAQDRPSPEWQPVLAAPESLSHVLTIPAPQHPGQRMELRGRVLKSDGRTPAPGVVVYFHHTDGRGIYPRPPNSRPTDWVYWHGSLRGWLKSDAGGNYHLKTTRPMPYPGGGTPAHIHAYGLAPGSRQGVAFQEIHFHGDPYLRASDRGVIRLTPDKNGVLQGRLDLVMPR